MASIQVICSFDAGNNNVRVCGYRHMRPWKSKWYGWTGTWQVVHLEDISTVLICLDGVGVPQAVNWKKGKFCYTPIAQKCLHDKIKEVDAFDESKFIGAFDESKCIEVDEFEYVIEDDEQDEDMVILCK